MTLHILKPDRPTVLRDELSATRDHAVTLNSRFIGILKDAEFNRFHGNQGRADSLEREAIAVKSQLDAVVKVIFELERALDWAEAGTSAAPVVEH